MDILNKFFRKKKINGKEYQISLLPALKAVRIGKSIMKVVLPIVGGTFDGMRDDGSYGPPRTFSEMALLLCDQVDKVDVEELIMELLDNATCNGKEFDIDDHFKGEIGELISVLEFSLKENFSSFFTGSDLLSRFKGMMAKVQDEKNTESEEQ